jgi:chemotaxis protein MotB
MQKKAKAEEPAGESAPMWIVSFADLVTLMMSFFVVLYAMKQGGEKRQLGVAVAIKATFDPSYTPPIDSVSEFDQAIRRYKGLPGPPYLNSGGHALKPTDGAEGLDQTVTAIRPGKQIVTGTRITFDLNSAALDPASLQAIAQIAEKIRGLNNILFVKGHVAADEIALRPDDPQGMNLSNQRATQVIEEFARLGIDRRVLRPLACGPYEPLKTGAYDAATLQLNRRVEVFTTENTASDYIPINTVPATEKPAASASAPTPLVTALAPTAPPASSHATEEKKPAAK